MMQRMIEFIETYSASKENKELRQTFNCRERERNKMKLYKIATFIWHKIVEFKGVFEKMQN